MDTQPNEASPAYIKMDFSIEDPKARVAKVNEILANTPPERLTPKYLEKLSNYIILAMDKKERMQKNILTDNRMVTINKRETSFEGLVSKMEAGENSLHNMIANDKNILFTPKKGFTTEEINTIPGLKELINNIKAEDEYFKKATGRKKYLLKRQIIEMQQDQYELKKSFKRPIYLMNKIKSISKLDLSEKIFINAEGEVESTGLINLFNPKHISTLLCHYSKIKEDSWDKFNSDIKWLIVDLENLVEKTLKEDYPLYYDLLIYKIDGKSNAEIQNLLYEKHNIRHSVEYISSLWRNKIPELLAKKAADEWLVWHYTMEEPGKWKRCSKCGQIKLAHNHFFSKNNASKDGFYSICKECRNKKKKG